MQESIVKFEHVSMQFPGVLANDDVSFDIKKGKYEDIIETDTNGSRPILAHDGWYYLKKNGQLVHQDKLK